MLGRGDPSLSEAEGGLYRRYFGLPPVERITGRKAPYENLRIPGGWTVTAGAHDGQMTGSCQRGPRQLGPWGPGGPLGAQGPREPGKA